jgi:proteic killer suppression protein
MIETWANKGTEDIFNGDATKDALKVCPKEAWGRAADLLDQINGAKSLGDIRLPPSNNLHKLKGKLKDVWAVSINKGFRITFKFENGQAKEVGISNHYED